MTRNPGMGAATRDTILRLAADQASVEGLGGLSIGQLATQLGMSKSGLFAHFGSKERLQLATIEDARRRYVEAVLVPALRAPRGIRRLDALCDSFLSYVERAVFPGGCFFAAAMAEFGGKEPGPVRDKIADCQRQWTATLQRAADAARDCAELMDACETEQLAFELEAALLSANWYVRLYDDPSYFDRARHAVRSLLEAGSTPTGRQALP
ncbi:MAG: TetR/AcrR family transcriptional regulator [Ilumatobacteraceae bacterium]